MLRKMLYDRGYRPLDEIPLKKEQSFSGEGFV